MAIDIFPYALAPYCAVLKADANPSLLSRLFDLIAEAQTLRAARGTVRALPATIHRPANMQEVS
jgi:hypothetical protein